MSCQSYHFSRLIMGLVFCVLVYYTPMFADEDGKFPVFYYAMVLVIYAFHQVKLSHFIQNCFLPHPLSH